MQDISLLTDAGNGLGGVNVVAQIYWFAWKDKFGDGSGSLILWVIPLGANFFSALHSITSASRLVQAVRAVGLSGSLLFPLYAVRCFCTCYAVLQQLDLLTVALACQTFSRLPHGQQSEYRSALTWCYLRCIVLFAPTITMPFSCTSRPGPDVTALLQRPKAALLDQAPSPGLAASVLLQSPDVAVIALGAEAQFVIALLTLYVQNQQCRWQGN